MSTRKHNESKFRHWDDLPDGGRMYRYELVGRNSWTAKYFKEVDRHEFTLRFWQEVYDEQGALVEVHEKYPVDKGHRKV